MGEKLSLTEKILDLDRTRFLLDTCMDQDTEIVLKTAENLTLVLLPRAAANRKKLTVYLKGDGSRVEILGMVVGRENEDYQVDIRTIHQGLNTSAHTAVRGVLFESSRLNFSGMIKIEKGADKTMSLLENRVLVLGEAAKANSLPSLEIEADDVKASHAATIGRVDAAALFYLQSRGLPRQNAVGLLSEGFFEPILRKLTNRPMVKEVRQQIWRSLSKQLKKKN